MSERLLGRAGHDKNRLWQVGTAGDAFRMSAHELRLIDGCLVFLDATGGLLRAFSAGTWQEVSPS